MVKIVMSLGRFKGRSDRLVWSLRERRKGARGFARPAGICRVGGRENYFHCDTCDSWRHSVAAGGSAAAGAASVARDASVEGDC